MLRKVIQDLNLKLDDDNIIFPISSVTHRYLNDLVHFCKFSRHLTAENVSDDAVFLVETT